MSEQIFISYRRDGGDVTAKLICEALKNKGYSVFYDFDSIHGGYFDERILRSIEACNDFVLVLPENALDRCVNSDDWVRQEIECAKANNKNIIPVMLPGFTFPKELPESIEDISRINAIEFTMAYFDAVIDAIIKRFVSSAAQSIANDAVNSAVFQAVTPMLKRVFLFLEDGEWDKADQYCEKVLDIDPENGQAYLGKLMIDLKLKKQEELKDCEAPFEKNNNYQKAMRFADSSLKAVLEGYIAEINARKEQARIKSVYSQAKAMMDKAAGEADYRRAAELFESISGYLDSDLLTSQCQEAANKEEERKKEAEARRQEDVQRRQRIAEEKRKESDERERCEALFAQLNSAIKYAQNKNEKNAKIEDGIKALNAKCERLTRLKNEWRSITEQIISLNQRIQATNTERNNLIKEKSKLGLFSGNRKKEIDDNLASLYVRQNRLNQEINKVSEKKQGYSYFAELCKDLDETRAELLSRKVFLEAENKSKANAQSTDSIRAEMIKYDYGRFLLGLPSSRTVVGDVVKFGRYEQDGSESNGKEEIEWLILAKENNKLLVISKYALDCKPYNTVQGDTNWERCSLRGWLNGEFFNSAFSREEAALISETAVSTQNNPVFGTKAGNETIDKVFALSIAEARKYFSTDSTRACKATAYAVQNGVYVMNSSRSCCWWLRTPGQTSNFASGVFYSGKIETEGTNVSVVSNAVRPAMWINVGN